MTLALTVLIGWICIWLYRDKHFRNKEDHPKEVLEMKKHDREKLWGAKCWRDGEDI